MPLYVLVSLALAMLLNRAGRAAGFFRTAFYLPHMTPPVAVGVLLLLVFNGQNGLINEVLGFFGIDGPNWTTDPDWVKPAIILTSLWSVGSSMIILLAALRNVPQELYDAARATARTRGTARCASRSR
ncbi:carbohydrate ABC transporter permease [Georgenia sp. SUBG003]|uniref:carbohydrate ABC transporter permease n=1 Tax=Georgenia sp. SUBG003 TaxID=1497974 RepID=UPI000ADCE486